MKTWTLAGVVLCLVAVPAVARAQGVAGSLAELRLLVRTGDKISVTDVSGREATGRISELSPASLSLLVDGRPQVWQEGDIRSISQRRQDSLANGAWIGLGIGAAVSAAAVVAISNDEDVDAGPAAAFVALYAGIGTAIGVGVDALITRRQVIFQKQSPFGPTMGLHAQVTAKRAAISLAITF